VPLTGTPLDDDMIQTAGRLAGEETDPGLDHAGSTIEALWIFEVPMALPIDARLPDAQLERARAALRRAKAVGEEYEGVEVATATVRARRAGTAIVDEARRRGVQAIVLAAEEPSRIRGGALLGGRGGPMDNFVGDATKYVVSKASCEVILTAPASSVPVVGAPDPEPPVTPADDGAPAHDQSISAAPTRHERPSP
jgi:APA family basic amino acid/polyamine antiporter